MQSFFSQKIRFIFWKKYFLYCRMIKWTGLFEASIHELEFALVKFCKLAKCVDGFWLEPCLRSIHLVEFAVCKRERWITFVISRGFMCLFNIYVNILSTLKSINGNCKRCRWHITQKIKHKHRNFTIGGTVEDLVLSHAVEFSDNPSTTSGSVRFCNAFDE